MFLTLTCLFNVSNARQSSQGVDPTVYYPLSVGNYWEYYDLDMWGHPADTASVTSIGDTLLSGRSYAVLRNYSFHYHVGGVGYRRYDSAGNLVGYDVSTSLDRVLLRLSDTSKTPWPYGNDLAIFDTSFTSIIFGTNRNTLHISTYDPLDTNFTIPGSTHWLIEGIGYGGYTFGGEPQGWRLRGAIINGVTYGTVTSIDSRDAFHPRSFGLQDIYPNPFNPETTIRYVVDHSGHIRLAIFDLLGREIQVLFDGQQSPGEYSVRWRPANLPTGIYLVSMRSETASSIKKIVLVR